MSDQIVERIRTAAEELTGVPSAAPAVQDSSGDRGRGILVASAACVVMLLVGLVVTATLRRDDAATTPGPPLSSMTDRSVTSVPCWSNAAFTAWLA